MRLQKAENRFSNAPPVIPEKRGLYQNLSDLFEKSKNLALELGLKAPNTWRI